jgi:hypothetical protein
MPLWLQYLLVAVLVLGAIAFLSRQIWATLMGKKSKLGSCCSTGCAAHQPSAKDSTTQRIQFLPAEMLGRKK